MVIDALDKFKDFLVSDKIMNLVEEPMRDFRNKLMNEPPPKTVNLLINFIFSKGIRRGKSSEGNEPFHGEETDQVESVCDKNDKEEDADAESPLKSLDGDIPIERARAK